MEYKAIVSIFVLTDVDVNAYTNMHSDASDDMNDVLVQDLPECLLASTCDLNLSGKGNKQKSVQCTQPANKKSRKSAARN